MKNETKLPKANSLTGEFDDTRKNEDTQSSDSRVFAIAGKADWSREKKFKNRLQGSNKKYLKPYLKG
jgi:hypothetical protein